MRITKQSQIVNMNDVNAIYSAAGEFTQLINGITNEIISDLERLASSNVIQYGDVGTKPLFDMLIEELEKLASDLKTYADNRLDDFGNICTLEEIDYQNYLEELAAEQERLERMGDIG